MTYLIHIEDEGVAGASDERFETLEAALAACQPWVDSGDWRGAPDDAPGGVYVLIRTVEIDEEGDEDAGDLVESVWCEITV